MRIFKLEHISPTDVSYAMTPDGRSVLLPRTEKIRQLRDEIFLVSSGTLGPLSPGDLKSEWLLRVLGFPSLMAHRMTLVGMSIKELLMSQGATV